MTLALNQRQEEILRVIAKQLATRGRMTEVRFALRPGGRLQRDTQVLHIEGRAFDGRMREFSWIVGSYADIDLALVVIGEATDRWCEGRQ